MNMFSNSLILSMGLLAWVGMGLSVLPVTISKIHINSSSGAIQLRNLQFFLHMR